MLYSNRKCIHSEGGAHLFYANFVGLQRSLGWGWGWGVGWYIETALTSKSVELWQDSLPCICTELRHVIPHLCGTIAGLPRMYMYWTKACYSTPLYHYCTVPSHVQVLNYSHLNPHLCTTIAGLPHMYMYWTKATLFHTSVQLLQGFLACICTELRPPYSTLLYNYCSTPSHVYVLN